MKMWIGGIEGNGELISAEKISISKMMRWKPASHVHNHKDGVFEKSQKSKLESKNKRG